MRDFNFFEPYIGQKKRGISNTICKVIIPVITALLIVGDFAGVRIYGYILNSKIGDYNKKLQEASAKIAKVEQQNKIYSAVNSYYDSVKAISSDIDSMDDFNYQYIQEIKSTLPKDVSISNMSFSENGADISGNGKSRENIAEFQHNLRALEQFEDVSLNKVNEDDDQSFSFDMTCIMRGGADDGKE